MSRQVARGSGVSERETALIFLSRTFVALRLSALKVIRSLLPALLYDPQGLRDGAVFEQKPGNGVPSARSHNVTRVKLLRAQ